jgi:hypothetical protein
MSEQLNVGGATWPEPPAAGAEDGSAGGRMKDRSGSDRPGLGDERRGQPGIGARLCRAARAEQRRRDQQRAAPANASACLTGQVATVSAPSCSEIATSIE